MKAEIHLDGTLRITPDSITELVALTRWYDDTLAPERSRTALFLKQDQLVIQQSNQAEETTK